MSQKPNVGIVADWLVTYAGAERVIKEFLDIFPESELYSIVDFLQPEARNELHGKHAVTSFIQNLPKSKTIIKSICH